MRRFPTARLVVMVHILFFPFFFEIPAIIFSFFWLLTQVIPGIVTLMMPADCGGIAWWAHIGGFMVGWVLAPLIGRSVRSYRRYYADEGRKAIRQLEAAATELLSKHMKEEVARVNAIPSDSNSLL